MFTSPNPSNIVSQLHMIYSPQYYKPYGSTDRKDCTKLNTVRVPASNTRKGSMCTIIIEDENIIMKTQDQDSSHRSCLEILYTQSPEEVLRKQQLPVRNVCPGRPAVSRLVIQI